MDQPREVVITGVGVVSPIGIGREPFWQSLEQGRSGVRRLSDYEGAPDVPFQMGAPVDDFEGKNYVQPRKSLKVMCTEIQSAYGSAALAMQDAGLAKGNLNPDRFGVVLGSEMLYGELAEVMDVFSHCVDDGEFNFARWGDHAFKDLFPLWMLKYLPNMAACHIGIAHDARGPTNSIVQGEVSSLLAISEAIHVIARGTADVMLAGGSGSRLTTSALTFRRHDFMAQWEGDPAAASRPFDSQHSGLVFGEGSGVIVLESRAHAQQRGATILAKVLSTANHFESPSKAGGLTGSAVKNCIASTLKRANLTPADLGHINAHGDSYVPSDRLEAQAIHHAAPDVPVVALKSYFGDLGAGSGAVELIGSVLALANEKVPATLNFEQPDAHCPVNVLRETTNSLHQPTALVLNQAFTGHAAGVLLGKN